MNKDEARELLGKLTERQREVLKFFCEGRIYKEIGKRLHIEVPSVKTHMGNIYIKLGLDILDPPERRKLLFQVFCPLLPENLPPAPPDDNERKTISDEVKSKVDEDEKALVTIEPINIVPPPIKRPRITIWEILRRAFTAIGVLTVILLILLVVDIIQLPWTNDQPISTPLIVAEVEATEDQVIAELPQSTETQVMPASSTSIPLPTNTLIPILTNTPQPTKTTTPEPLFADDFSQGLSSEWEVELGTTYIVNGMLTSSEETWLFVGDQNWTNYQVEFDADPSRCTPSGNSGNAIAVRVQDISNMITFVFVDCGGAWYTVIDGTWQLVPGQESGLGIGSGMVKVVVQVLGNEFTISADGVRLASFFDDSFTSGKVGLRLAKDTLIDNFRVVEK